MVLLAVVEIKCQVGGDRTRTMRMMIILTWRDEKKNITIFAMRTNSISFRPSNKSREESGAYIEKWKTN